MSFWLWTPATGSTAAVASTNVLSLEASTMTHGALVHVRPAGTADVELEVSNGVSVGGGTIHRYASGTHSSRSIKKDIRYLTEADEERAYQDVLALRPVRFRYKVIGPDGALRADPSQPLMKGLLYEESPESIRGKGETIVIDYQVANLELALKAALRKVQALEERLARLKAREGTAQ